MVKDDGTPMSRLRAAVDQLDRDERQHVTKVESTASAKRELERRELEEAEAFKRVEASRTAVKRAAKDVE